VLLSEGAGFCYPRTGSGAMFRIRKWRFSHLLAAAVSFNSTKVIG
jgi:hypothetical protein